MPPVAEASVLARRGGGRECCFLPGEMSGGAWNSHDSARHGCGQNPPESHHSQCPKALRARERCHSFREALHRRRQASLLRSGLARNCPHPFGFLRTFIDGLKHTSRLRELNGMAALSASVRKMPGP
ncbi:hypothetical protein L345_01569, partial [Ophiophagus hannah]